MTCDMAAQWDKTMIPHILKGKDGVRKVVTLVKKCKDLTKVPIGRRGSDFAKEMKCLFDVATCLHSNLQTCDCSPDFRIPANWWDFLTDQHGTQTSKVLISDWAMSLCDCI